MKNLRPILDFSLLSAVICLLTIYTLAYGWSADGFSQGEIIWLALLPGLLTFAISLTLISTCLTKYLRQCRAQGIEPAKWWQLLLGTTGLVTVSLIAIDALFFYLADSSLSSNYAEALGTFDQSSSAMKEATIKAFAELPFLMQNGVTIAVFVLLANSLAVGIAKYLTKKPVLELQ
ncbi:hypothetical protein E5K00_06985 [Hymenobacter aquaticus]|uniref:DUF4199 domain-containing protein n=1 Tax=Hymenobacter aquaticus TaxID=1867101 RepID=A0A4Z0Q4H5_9BACT|nr:hypothetical protein [Hymenobacter aquaticus]TGE24937.1 hypothetical protein E5K00_06985 [Hymenobacter aquaticus]